MSDAEIRVKFEMCDGLAEVRIITDLGEELVEQHGPYLLTEMADVEALVRFVSKNVGPTALAFLAKTGAAVCEERS